MKCPESIFVVRLNACRVRRLFLSEDKLIMIASVFSVVADTGVSTEVTLPKFSYHYPPVRQHTVSVCKPDLSVKLTTGDWFQNKFFSDPSVDNLCYDVLRRHIVVVCCCLYVVILCI